MTRSSTSRKRKRFIKKDNKKVGKIDPQRYVRWYELIDYFDGSKIVTMKSEQNLRAFALGTIRDILFVQVPVNASSESVRAMMETLRSQGIRAVAVGEDIKFMRFRMCSVEEERLLFSADTNNTGFVMTADQAVGKKDDKAQVQPES